MRFTVSRRSRVFRTIGILAAASGLGLMAGCSSSDDSGSSGGSTAAGGVSLVKSGTLTVCTHLPYKPFEYDDGGQVVGFDADMLGLLAKKLDVKMNVISTGWTQITGGAAFAAKQCDLGMGAATITPARAKSVAFSDPYFDATQALLVKTAAAYATLPDLKGKKLGVQSGTTGEIYAKKHASEDGYSIVEFDDSLSEFNAVKTGKVDAAINDNGPELYFATQNSDTKVTKQFDTGEHYGYMAKKDDSSTKLLDTLNTVIKTSKSDGTYDQIFKKYFGTVPGDVGKS
jgi:polar amino acid transport system substrate-binding protein